MELGWKIHVGLASPEKLVCCSALGCCGCRCEHPWMPSWEGQGMVPVPRLLLRVSPLSRALLGVLVLLTEAPCWSPTNYFWGRITFFNLFCRDFLPHWRRDWGEHSEMLSWSHRSLLSCRPGSLEEFWT